MPRAVTPSSGWARLCDNAAFIRKCAGGPVIYVTLNESALR
jgi:hypothetical protein